MSGNLRARDAGISLTFDLFSLGRWFVTFWHLGVLRGQVGGAVLNGIKEIGDRATPAHQRARRELQGGPDRNGRAGAAAVCPALVMDRKREAIAAFVRKGTIHCWEISTIEPNHSEQARCLNLKARGSKIADVSPLVGLTQISSSARSLYQRLAMARRERYQLSKQQDDLEQAIVHCTELVFLPLPWHHGCPLTVFGIFYFITSALSFRPLESKRPEDVKWCIRSLRYLYKQPLAAFNIPPSHVSAILVLQLAHRMKLESRDDVQDIEEVAILCLELLNSEMPRSLLIIPVMGLDIAATAYFVRWREPGRERTEPSEKLIECLREANRCLPDVHQHRVGTRICREGDPPLSYLAFGTSLNNPARPVIIEQLAQLLDLRSNDFGVTEDLQDGRSDDSEPQNIPPFRDLSDALRRSSNGESTPIELEDQYFDALSLRLVDIADLEDAIMYARLLLASCHPGSRNAALVSAFLGMALIKAFSWTNSIKTSTRQFLSFGMVDPPLLNRGTFRTLKTLSHFCVPASTWRYKKDLDDVMQLYPIAIKKHAKTPDRFRISWGQRMRAGRFHRAVEILEQGRALIWSEMRGLRTSVDQLRAADSRLADKLVAVNGELEMLLLTSDTDGGDDGWEEWIKWSLLVKQRKLLDDVTIFVQ
ncbi:hypothetical protein F5148DRAFT_1153151, partial [Russula earlei]